jgi:branched-chain amino acid transport system permease protein
MKKVSGLLVIAFLISIPFYSGEYYINLGSQMLIAAIFASSLNLLVGYGGLTSLGHAVYLGLSAYIAALLVTKLGMNQAETAVIALTATTVMGMIFGWIALRATGLGFLMLTLALSQIFWGLAYRWVSMTNGDNGISGITRPTPLGINLDESHYFYWFVLSIFLASIFIISRIVQSPFGVSICGTRDQAKRMTALGFNVWLIRWITFVLASFFGAVAGLLYVYFHKYIHPTVMSITSSAEALLCVIAGGAGTLTGPIVGAFLVMILKNYVSGYVERWNMLLGAVFVFIVLFMPSGITPWAADKIRIMRNKFK